MLMIPTQSPTGRLLELPDGPQLLAATLWGGCDSPDTVGQQATAWMKGVLRPVRDPSTALQAIAWAQGLPSLRKILGSEVWRALDEFLLSLPADVDTQTLHDHPLIHQLLAAELAWTLATRSAEVPCVPRLEKAGRAAIAFGLGQILDRQGMLPAKHLGLLRPILACWTRCRMLSAGLPGGGLGARSEQRYEKFVRNALRCTRPDGRPLLADSANDPWGRELFESALRSSATAIDRRLAALALPKLSPGVAVKSPKKASDLPPASICCEDGAVAIMRRNWNRDDERLAVLFAHKSCQLELISSGLVTASGEWGFEITQQGQQLVPVSRWDTNCWYTDEDVDFLELEIELSGSVTLQRQIVLAREDRFLLLADIVMSPQPGNLAYRGVLPLVPEINFIGGKENCEGFLVGGRRATPRGKAAAAARPLAQVLPLALPEWRAEKSNGTLQKVPEGLELRQTIAGQRLYAPLFLDLDRSRFRRRMTWRHLSVVESLKEVPLQTAVGFRVAIGNEQWIIYRSLAARANRTVLGHNLATELLIARFGKDGEVSPIVEIE